MHYFVEPTGDNPKYPCGICNKTIGKNHRFIRCNLCNFKIHMKCNETDEKSYNKMKNNETTMICIKCLEENIPFFSSCNNEIKKDPNNLQNLASNSIKTFFKGLNEFNNNQIRDDDDDDDDDDEGVNNKLPLNCKYTDINNFHFQNNKTDFSLFHLNIASLSKHKEELETTLAMLNFNFDIIGISETKIKKHSAPIYDISLKGYNLFYTPTESEGGGVSFYILLIIKNVNLEKTWTP